MKIFLKWLSIIIAIFCIVYFVGPKPTAAKFDAILPPPIMLPTKSMDSVVAAQEKQFNIKPTCQSQIVWADSTKQKTEFAILYLPGFTASQTEGDPIHKLIAKKFNCNLYLPRMYGHGLTDTLHAFEDFTADKYWEGALKALAIAKNLGKKVIIMGTSTGGSLGLKLAAEHGASIAGQIYMSPNIEINNPTAFVLNNPWGKQIASYVKGGDTFFSDRQDTTYKKYWDARYNVNGAVQLEEFLEKTMTEKTFKKVTAPLCLLYYYKDETHQDPVVKVSAMLNMYKKISTPNNAKQEFAIPNAGNHVIGSYIQSKDLVTVEEKITNFCINILEMKQK